MKLKTQILIIFMVLFFFSNCKDKYNFQIQPPTPNAKVVSLFPTEIYGQIGSIHKMELPEGWLGFMSVYGQSYFEIQILQSVNQEPKIVENFFKEYLFQHYQTIRTDSFLLQKKQWFILEKTEKLELIAWTNQNWIFIITAKQPNPIKAVIEKFEYIQTF